jgi:SAM-dependent methyltransferase
MTTNQCEKRDIPSLNPDALDKLLGQVVSDLGAAVNGALVVLGDRLGIYSELSEIGPARSHELAAKTGLEERQLREWLSVQAASGYITYDAEIDAFSLTAEQAAVFADPKSPAAMTGGFYSISSVYHDEPRVAESFQTGAGVPWGDHHNCLFCGVERFVRPGYEANLLTQWIPALDGVKERLESGIRIADIGCGHGASTLIMAQAFPKSEFYGFDLHPPSIEAANRHASEQGITNVHFGSATAKDFPVTTNLQRSSMRCMTWAIRSEQRRISADRFLPTGAFMIVEPMAGDSLAENLNPVGRVYYGFSTMVCTPASLSQEVGLALGAQAGERRLREVLAKGGFTRIRRATETPFNMILEARP